jgi:hypothetical protein
MMHPYTLTHGIYTVHLIHCSIQCWTSHAMFYYYYYHYFFVIIFFLVSFCPIVFWFSFVCLFLRYILYFLIILIHNKLWTKQVSLVRPIVKLHVVEQVVLELLQCLSMPTWEDTIGIPWTKNTRGDSWNIKQLLGPFVLFLFTDHIWE